MPGPRITVVIPYYKAEQFLEEAIESVLAQTFREWELLLVDDGSPDRCPEIARTYAGRYGSKIFHLWHEGNVNRGSSASRNLAFARARGEWVAMLDADDVWVPGKLEQQLALVESHPDVGLIWGTPRYWRSWNGAAGGDFVPQLGLEPGRVYRPPEVALSLYPLGSMPAPCPSDLLIAKRMLDEVGGYDERFTGPLQLFEDQVLLMKLYLRTSVLTSDSCWTLYRLHDESCCSTAEREGTSESSRRYFATWLQQYFEAEGIDDERLLGALRRFVATSRRGSRLRWFQRAVTRLCRAATSVIGGRAR